MAIENTGQQELEFRGTLEAHSGWVTAIATPHNGSSDTIVSASRDKRLMVWSLKPNDRDAIGIAMKSLTGHSHYIQDVVISNDGLYAISGSWDKTLRLWDLVAGKSLRTFVGHKSDAHCVAFSLDNRQIVSAGRDKTIKLWNTLAECKYTIEEGLHTDWVSCVKFVPTIASKTIVTAGWDGLVKVWNLETCKLKHNLAKHQAAVYTIAVSPDGSLCASGGKDRVAMLWDIHEGKHLYSLDGHHSINALCFSPCNYWLCAATDKNIIIWDLENKNTLAELNPPKSYKSALPWCISLAWTADGKMLLAGCTDNNIYVYEVTRQY